ncbi:MAG: zinc ribbon domain-containing protein [Clostridia bacterium]|nr:zinc ribbon domain-containing protein [Clostridia bacterium]
MKCRNCEKEMNEEMAFCPYCGTEAKRETTENEQEISFQASSEDVGSQKGNIYCVVITGSKNGLFPLIDLIRKKTGLNLSMSKKLAEKMPLPLFSDLTEDEAKSIVVELDKDGIMANVQDQSAISQRTNGNSDEQAKNTESQTDTRLDKKEKLKTSTVLSAVGAVLSVIAALCILLLPLFTKTYSETISGETIYKEKSISMLIFVIESVISITAFSSTSAYIYLDWLYLIFKVAITIAVISLIISSIKASVEKLRNLINFEEYCKNELSKDASVRSAEDLVIAFKNASKSNQLFQVIMDLMLIIFIFGYGTVIWSTVIAILIMSFIAYIIEKIAVWTKKKALA